MRKTTEASRAAIFALALAGLAGCGLEKLVEDPCLHGQATFTAYGSTFTNCLDPSISTPQTLEATDENYRGNACQIHVPRTVGAHQIQTGTPQSVTAVVAIISGKGQLEANSAYGSGSVTVEAISATAANGTFAVQAKASDGSGLVPVSGSFEMKF